MNLPPDASNDQANCPNGYYRNTSGMLNIIPQHQPALADSSPISAGDLARLDGMSREELVGLVMASNADKISYALLSPQVRIMAYRMRLHDMAMNAKDDKVALNAINQISDRMEGKPIGTATNINIGGSGEGLTKIQVVLVNAADYRREQEAKKTIEHMTTL